MVWNKNKKNIYPSMPQFHYIILVCEGLLIIGSCLLDGKKVAHTGAMMPLLNIGLIFQLA